MKKKFKITWTERAWYSTFVEAENKNEALNRFRDGFHTNPKKDHCETEEESLIIEEPETPVRYPYQEKH